MNKVKGYINILITISVILVVLGLVFSMPVRGNLYDLIFTFYSSGFIGFLIGIYFLYIFIVIPVRTIKSIYESGGINDQAFLKMNMESNSKIVIWFWRIWGALVIITLIAQNFETSDDNSNSAIERAVESVIRDECKNDYTDIDDIELCTKTRFTKEKLEGGIPKTITRDMIRDIYRSECEAELSNEQDIELCTNERFDKQMRRIEETLEEARRKGIID
jgi:hypothetical protein